MYYLCRRNKGADQLRRYSAADLYLYFPICRKQVFFMTRLNLFVPVSDQLRALYLGDNDFETFPPEVGRLKSLQIVRLVS